MMLLAVDTSTAQIGLAFFDGAQVSAESLWYSHQHHTVELAPALAELLRRTGVTMGDVQALGVALGPGSFTALRVGLSFIKGLALARHIPIIGIPTLDVLAGGLPLTRLPLAAVLQAGRGRLAVGMYKPTKAGWKSIGERASEKIMTVDELADSIDKPTLVAGELNAEDRQRLARKKVNVVLAAPSLCVRRPSVLAELAWTRWQNGKVDESASLAPIYLHLADPIPA
jgi:tRNA threonylcarbamoyladenosine biosynthesis protein TsaB